MKNRLLMFVACLGFLLLLTACKGSKQIQGTWQAQDSAGKNVTITISKNTIKIGKKSFDYTQNVVGVKNLIHYYGLKINKKMYSFILPPKQKDAALLLEPDSEDNYLLGNLVYAMNKKNQPDYKAYVNKYLDWVKNRQNIVGRSASFDNGEGQSFSDYVGVVYPNGIDPENALFFNQEDIDEGVFTGYSDEEEDRYLKVYEEWKAEMAQANKSEIDDLTFGF